MAKSLEVLRIRSIGWRKLEKRFSAKIRPKTAHTDPAGPAPSPLKPHLARTRYPTFFNIHAPFEKLRTPECFHPLHKHVYSPRTHLPRHQREIQNCTSEKMGKSENFHFFHHPLPPLKHKASPVLGHVLNFSLE
jgi:hypothetical protein